MISSLHWCCLIGFFFFLNQCKHSSLILFSSKIYSLLKKAIFVLWKSKQLKTSMEEVKVPLKHCLIHVKLVPGLYVTEGFSEHRTGFSPMWIVHPDALTLKLKPQQSLFSCSWKFKHSSRQAASSWVALIMDNRFADVITQSDVFLHSWQGPAHITHFKNKILFFLPHPTNIL